MDNKKCLKCNIKQPINNFYGACKSRKSHQSYCIKCYKIINNSRYVKVADRPNYKPKKVGRKTKALLPEQMEIVKAHKGSMAALARKLNINYETIKYYKRVGKI
mgnify:CR=1 FL=1|tara:strand:+ start:128 stop:439 length:312 start_codon:yes stop_codon:yes gene_type:complete